MAGETGKDGRSVACDNGTLLDTKTNLMWASKDKGSDIHWNANGCCENCRGGGYADWRTPTQDELSEWHDVGKNYGSECGNDVHFAGLIRLACGRAWVSEAGGSEAASPYFSFGGRVRYLQSLDSASGLSRRALGNRLLDDPFWAADQDHDLLGDRRIY